MEAGELYWSVIDPYWDRVNIYDGPEVFLQEFSLIAECARNLLAAHWCQSEVRNGGFEQFFHNSTGVLAPEAVAAFMSIGLPKLGSVVESAMGLLGRPYRRERDARLAALEMLQGTNPGRDVFDAYDNQFFQLIDQEGGGWEAAADNYAQPPRG